MHFNKYRHLAFLISVAAHAMIVAFIGNYPFKTRSESEVPKSVEFVTYLELSPHLSSKDLAQPLRRDVAPKPKPVPKLSVPLPPEQTSTPQVANRQTASQAAPPAPTAEEWAFAASYTLKNSKGYRYSWGQQVRSMMGTAVEGADQGVVRFRVEISPNGTLAKLETLWTTSTVAERLARNAIEEMPPLPPTPTGKPLVFERTISFSASASDGPPIYQDDCNPDPPAFRNPFAWDGKSPQRRAAQEPNEKPDPKDLEDCRKHLPRDSIEAESARDQRLLDQWGSRLRGN